MDIDQEDLTPSTPSPPPPRAPRRLVRRSEGKVIGGVCAGIADYFAVDPVLVRLGAVVLTLAGGSGLVAYAIAWMVLPEDSAGTGTRTGAGQGVNWGVVIGVGLLLVVLVVTVEESHWWDAGWGEGFGRAGPLLLIVGGGVLLWKGGEWFGRSERRSAPGAPTEALPAVPVPQAWPIPPSPPPVPAGPAGPARRAGGASWIFGVLLVAMGILGLLVAAGFDSDLVDVGGIALVAVGAGLLIGAFAGRLRWLIAVGLLVMAGVTGAVLLDVALEGGIGTREYEVRSLEELRRDYRLMIGELDVDLSALELGTGRQETVELSVALGELVVVVPADVSLTVESQVAAGQLTVLGRTHDGTDVELDRVDRRAEGTGRLVIDARVGLGRVEVRRGSS